MGYAGTKDIRSYFNETKDQRGIVNFDPALNVDRVDRMHHHQDGLL